MLDEQAVEALLQAVKMAATVKCPDGSEAGGWPSAAEPPHASGVGVSGRFRPSPAARRRFRGELFDSASVDVAVRFSTGIACGLPTADRVNNVGLALWVDRGREQDETQGADRAALVALNVALFPTVDPVVFPKFLLAAHQAHEAHEARRRTWWARMPHRPRTRSPPSPGRTLAPSPACCSTDGPSSGAFPAGTTRRPTTVRTRSGSTAAGAGSCWRATAGSPPPAIGRAAGHPWAVLHPATGRTTPRR